MIPLASLKKELAKASKARERAERGVLVASIVAEALRSVGQDPILVGGAAVEFYTQGEYATADIDLVSEGGPDLVTVMKELGFERQGKDFVNKTLNLYMEFPSRSIQPSERTSVIQIGERPLRIISLEDLIVDRLYAFKFWKSGADGVAALMLLETDDWNLARLEQRTLEEDVGDALEAVQRINNEAVRKKISRKEATNLLEDWIRGQRKR